MKIVILGAGVGGLTTAIAFKKLGFNVEIYERHSKRSDIGAGIVCWPNATFVLDELGLLDDINQYSGKPEKMNRLTKNGEELGSIDILELNKKMGNMSFSILRNDLMNILESHLNRCGVKVKYGCEIEQLEESKSNSTKIRFKDGSNVDTTIINETDIVIGADGRMASKARQFVNGDNKPQYQGFINWIGVYQSDVPVFSKIEVFDYWGEGDRFGIVPISENKAYWAGAVAAEKIGDNNPELYKEELLGLFQDWSPININNGTKIRTANGKENRKINRKINRTNGMIKKIIEETSLSKINKIYVHDHDPIKIWHKNNVLLIGDAAHAPLPTSGQGACQAIEDAWHLSKLFEQLPANTNVDIQAIFQEFTKIRYDKTASITQGARQFASSLFKTDKIRSEARNTNSINMDYNLVANGMAKGWSSGLPIRTNGV